MNLSRASSMLHFAAPEANYWDRPDVYAMEDHIWMHVMIGFPQGTLWVIAREKAAVRLRPVMR